MAETPDLAKKLNLKPGFKVLLLAATSQAEALVRGSAPEGIHFSSSKGEAPFDVIIFWPRKRLELAVMLRELQNLIRPDGVVWAVIPKKKLAPHRGIDFNWNELQTAALETDLVDTKVASLSDEEYATKFVIRKARRQGFSRASPHC